MFHGRMLCVRTVMPRLVVEHRPRSLAGSSNGRSDYLLAESCQVAWYCQRVQHITHCDGDTLCIGRWASRSIVRSTFLAVRETVQ